MAPTKCCSHPGLPDASERGFGGPGGKDLCNTHRNVDAAEKLQDNTGALVCRKPPERHVFENGEVQLNRTEASENGVLLLRVTVRDQEAITALQVTIKMNAHFPSEHELESPE